MKKKVVVILLITALILTAGPIFSLPGEDSDCAGVTIDLLTWMTPAGKEGGDEGIFLCYFPGEDSD
ncbi:MAG: hypothetical protein HXS47_09725 [Theionarchaea archaeon]|nr:hypothetical protein [Theionarchaea archaeon]